MRSDVDELHERSRSRTLGATPAGRHRKQPGRPDGRAPSVATAIRPTAVESSPVGHLTTAGDVVTEGAASDKVAARRWTRGAAVLAAGSVAMGLANYVAALAMTRLVPAHEFSRYTAGQSLLLVLGTGSMAALPWAVSRFLVSPDYSRSPAEAMSFGLRGSALQGAVLGVLAFAVGCFIDGPAFGGAVGAAALMISLIAGPVGFFQGEGRLGVVAGLRLMETVVRIGTSITLVLVLQRSATVGLLGFAVGAGVAFGAALWMGRYAFPLSRPGKAITRDLGRQALLLGGVQVLLAMLAALDTVYVTVAHLSAGDAASYQAASVIGRIPLFVSAALCTACYPSMVAAQGENATGRVLGASFRQYLWLCVPFLVACTTVPHALLYRVIPAEYSHAQGLLRITCLLGVLVGAVNVLTTAHQARTFYRSATVILAVVCVGQAAALIGVGRIGNVTAFALSGVAVVALGLVALAVDGRRWLYRPELRPSFPGAAAVLVAGLVFAVPAGVVLWSVALAILASCCLLQALRPTPPRRPDVVSPQPPPISPGDSL